MAVADLEFWAASHISVQRWPVRRPVSVEWRSLYCDLTVDHPRWPWMDFLVNHTTHIHTYIPIYIYIYKCRKKQSLKRSSATANIASDAAETAIQGHSRSSVVVPIDAAYNYDFLLALNSNLTYSTVLKILHLVCKCIPTSHAVFELLGRPGIHVGGVRFYRDSVYLLFSSSSFFARYPQSSPDGTQPTRPRTRKWVRFENACPKSGVYPPVQIGSQNTPFLDDFAI